MGTEISQELPKAVTTAAVTCELGDLVTIHKPDGFMILLEVLTYIAMFPGIIGMFVAFEGSPWLLLPLTYSIFVLWLGQAMAFELRRGWSHLYEFEHGLVRFSRAAVETFAWVDVDYVVQGGRDQHELRRPDGTTALRLPSPNERAAARIGELALAQARVSMAHTGTARFGPVTATRGGLTIDGDFIAWAAVDQIDHDHEFLLVRGGDKPVWKSVPVGRVANVRALVALADLHMPASLPATPD